MTAQTQDTAQLTEIFNEILEAVFTEAAEAVQNRTGADVSKIRYADKIKIDIAKKVFDLSKKYNAETHFDKLVDCSNTIIPLVTRLFGEDKVLGRLPPHVKNEQVVGLLDKAGAREVSALLRKTLPAATVA